MSQTIAYTKPQLTDDTGKPPAIANQPYPYNSISSDRRFKELIYVV